MLNLGTDLRNDHPISIQYAGALTNGNQDRGALDTDFKSADATDSAAGTGTLYYIDTDGANGKSKSDLPLYNRAGGTQTSTGGIGFTANSLVGEPLVECATCHDPHRDNTTFLRNNDGNDVSATCLSCHIK
jgi:predicted CXXCH cytochrome family protein